VQPEVGLGRQREPDRIGSLSIDFHQVVAAAYQELTETDPKVILIDADGDLHGVAEMVLAEMTNRWS